MAVGRDVYVDSRMIIQRLEELYPDDSEFPMLSSKETAGLAALLNKFVIDGSVFSKGVGIMPAVSRIDNKFVKDRAGFYGKQWNIHDTAKHKPENMAHLKQCFEIAESLFVDNRDWVAGTSNPTLADLEGNVSCCAWSFAWILSDLQPPPKYFSKAIYPEVYAWCERFQAAVQSAQARAPKVVSLKGSEAVPYLLGRPLAELDPIVEPDDPLHLRRGALVDLYPTDGGGFTHQDRGTLVKLTKDEVAIEVHAPTGDAIYIHAPRWSFRIEEVASRAKLA
ncbi:hypothetical protein LTS10_003312 [Elasticomyces elasticus]|nr:hypothetical protein LTS10_003312 [Elasticomyces elasticus]